MSEDADARRRRERRERRARRERRRREAALESSSSSGSSSSSDPERAEERAERRRERRAARKERGGRRKSFVGSRRVDTPALEGKLFFASLGVFVLQLALVVAVAVGGEWSASSGAAASDEGTPSGFTARWGITRFRVDFSPPWKGLDSFESSYGAQEEVAFEAIQLYDNATGTVVDQDGSAVPVNISTYRNVQSVMEDLQAGGRRHTVIVAMCFVATGLLFSVLVADRRSAVIRPTVLDPVTGLERVVYASRVPSLYWAILVTCTLVMALPAVHWLLGSHRVIEDLYGLDASTLHLVRVSHSLGWCWGVSWLLVLTMAVPWAYFVTHLKRMGTIEGAVDPDVVEAATV